MPKHKKSSSSRHSREGRSSRKHHSRDSSRIDTSRERSRRERRQGKRSHRSRSSNELSECSPSREDLIQLLDQVRRYFVRQDTDLDPSQDQPLEVRSTTDEISVADVLAAQISASAPSASVQDTEKQTVAQADRGSVPVIPAIVNICDDEPHATHNVLFANPSATNILESQDPDISETHTLAKELFGEVQAPQASSAWDPVVLNCIQAESRCGLGEDTRTSLMTKYEVKEDLAALVPPKLNKELLAALTPYIIKRDGYQSLSQAQVGACLNAFGLGISLLLKPEILQELNQDARSALTYFSDGVHLLSDHHHRLSLTRRAFIQPSLNITGRNAAKSAPIDEFLFGQNFAETLKTAQACERTGREVSKSTLQVGKGTLQPIRQQTNVQRNQPRNFKPQIPGNRKASVRPTSARQTGAPYHKSRLHRSQSRPRSRYHQ